MTSYRAFDQLPKIYPANALPHHGVQMRMANFFFDKPIEEQPKNYCKMKEIENLTDVSNLWCLTLHQADIWPLQIRGFKRDPSLVTQHAVNQHAGVVDSYQHIAPVIDPDTYMAWLRFVIATKGAQFVTERITGDLLEQEDKLLEQHNAHAIIHCTGLGGRELASDKTVYPLRGALIKVVNDGTKFAKVNEALVVPHDYEKHDDDGGIVFIVPRNDYTLILGGKSRIYITSLSVICRTNNFDNLFQVLLNRDIITLI